TAFESWNVDRALAPDQIEGAGREVELAHVANSSVDAIGHAEGSRLAVCLVHKWRMVVDGHETGGGVAGEGTRLQSRPASQVEHASLGPDSGHEPQRPDGAGSVARSLPGQPVEDLEKQHGRPVSSHVFSPFKVGSALRPAVSPLFRLPGTFLSRIPRPEARAPSPEPPIA